MFGIDTAAAMQVTQSRRHSYLVCVSLSNRLTARMAAQEVVSEAVPMLAVPDASVDRFNTVCAQISDAQYAGGGVEVD